MRSKFASSWLRNHAAPSSVESTCSQNAFEPGEEEVGGAARGDEVALLGGGIGGSGRMLSNRRIVGVELDDGVTPLTICSARAAADTVLPVERVREVSDAGERRITPSSEVLDRWVPCRSRRCHHPPSDRGRRRQRRTGDHARHLVGAPLLRSLTVVGEEPRGGRRVRDVGELVSHQFGVLPADGGWCREVDHVAGGGGDLVHRAQRPPRRVVGGDQHSVMAGDHLGHRVVRRGERLRLTTLAARELREEPGGDVFATWRWGPHGRRRRHGGIAITAFRKVIVAAQCAGHRRHGCAPDPGLIPRGGGVGGAHRSGDSRSRGSVAARCPVGRGTGGVGLPEDRMERAGSGCDHRPPDTGRHAGLDGAGVDWRRSKRCAGSGRDR